MGIRFDGLSTGLNTSALIDALIGLERRPLVLTQNRQTDMREQQELFRTLNTQLLALRDAALAIDNRNSFQTGATLDEEFLAYTATSGDDGFLGAEANGNATPGAVDVRIDRVALAGREISNGFADPTAIISNAGQTIQIDVGGTQIVDFTVGAAGASLQDLRNSINADPNNDGSIRAEILFDGTTQRLTISSNQTGADNSVTITTNITGPAGAGDPLFDASLAQASEDAQIQVFGLVVTRPGNEISDVIPGVTLRLERAHDPADPTQSTTIEVSRNDEGIEEKLQTLVDAYNSVREFVVAQSRFNESTESAGPLSGDSTLLQLDRSVQAALSASYQVGSNPFSTLGQIGIRFDRDGLLSLDAEVLREALDQDALAVREMLMGDGLPLDANGVPTGVDGAATAIGRMLEPITRSDDGTLALRIEGFDDRIASLDQTIERFERRLEQREEMLIQRFARLETLVSSLQAQGNFLSSAFSQLNNNRNN